MKSPFPAVMFLFMLVGFVLGGCYLWVKIQVGKAGDRLTFLSREHDTLLFRKYREIAKTRHLSIWPIYLGSFSQRAHSWHRFGGNVSQRE